MSELFVLEIPHERKATAYEIDEKKFISHVKNAPEFADWIPQLGFKEDSLSLEQAREVISANLHAVYFFKDENEVLEFIKNYNGHQSTKCKVALEELLGWWDI
jgi:hypothetical protein